MAKRHAYQAQFKLKAISYAEEHGNRAAAKEFKINESMVRKWKKQENKLRLVKKTQLSFRGQKARWPELEKRLEQWIVEQRTSGTRVTTVTIRLKAVTLAEEMNIEHFQAGPSWCFRFMKRCHFSIRTNTKAAKQLPGDYKTNLPFFRSYCSKRITDRPVRSVRKSNCQEPPAIDNLTPPLDHNAQSEEEREHNSCANEDTSVTPAAHFTQTQELPLVGELREENGEEPSGSVTSCNDREDDGQREIKTEAVDSPLSSLSFTDVKPDILNEQYQGVNLPSVSTTRMLLLCLNSENTDATTSGHNTIQLQGMEEDERCPQTGQASDAVEAPLSDSNLDAMDLDQLKREKIKMQLKVLKLQEEYYSLRIKTLKQ